MANYIIAKIENLHVARHAGRADGCNFEEARGKARQLIPDISYWSLNHGYSATGRLVAKLVRIVAKQAG